MWHQPDVNAELKRFIQYILEKSDQSDDHIWLFKDVIDAHTAEH